MKNYKTQLILLCCFISQLAFCGPFDPPADGDEPTDPAGPAASINIWIIYLVIVGILYAFYTLKKKQVILKN
jgi:hypothetical protein